MGRLRWTVQPTEVNMDMICVIFGTIAMIAVLIPIAILMWVMIQIAFL